MWYVLSGRMQGKGEKKVNMEGKEGTDEKGN